MKDFVSDEAGYISHECFHAYVSAEMKVPNTLIAVGPYVGHAALESMSGAADLTAAVRKFANTYRFSREQMDSVIKAVSFAHGKFGVPVLPDGAYLADTHRPRIFKQARFEVVYMEGVLNILQSILLLHCVEIQKGGSQEAQVADLLRDPNKLATTIELFAAAERAVNSADASKRSDVFRETFNFLKTTEKPRAMKPEEKNAIQAQTMPFIIAAVREVLAGRKVDISEEQLKKFVFVLTSPELYREAA